MSSQSQQQLAAASRHHARFDRMVTALASEMYQSYCDWEEREFDRKLLPWTRLDKHFQCVWKQIAEAIVKARCKEGKLALNG